MSNSLKQLFPTLLPHAWQGVGVYALLLFVIAVIVSRAIRLIASRALNRKHQLHRGAVQFLAQFAQVVIWIVAVMVFLDLIPALQNLGTALLTGVSVASVVIGLAAQTTLSNFIAGFSLIFYRPFVVDDVLTITGPGGVPINGVIERLSLGYTLLRTFDDRRIVMPNNLIANQVVISSNHAQLRSMAIVSAILPTGKGADRVRQFLVDAANRNNAVVNLISCIELAVPEGGVSLSLRLWCCSEAAAQSVPRDIIPIVRENARAAGIKILLSNIEASAPEPG